MKYRYLGRSGLQVSEISLGSWLTYGNSVEKEQASKIIETAYDHGINYFDSANVYATGAAEKLVGETLKNYARDSYVVATKAFFPMSEKPNHSGLSRKHIFESVHASLSRLQMDYVDIFYCHRFDPLTPLEETLTAINDLIKQGKILYAGVSEWTPAQMAEAAQIADRRLLDPIIVNQPNYSMLYRHIEKDVLPYSEQSGIGQVAFSPLQQGVLTGKYKKGQKFPEGSRALDSSSNEYMGAFLTDDVLEKVERLEVLAQEHEWKLSQMALAWVLRNQNVASAIIGASRPEQLLENIESINITLDHSTLDQINAILGEQH